MKKLLLPIVSFFTLSLHAQQYWQQEVNFNISVSLNDKEHSLDAFETIEYINNSPDTLKYIWFHLWPNAYKNDKTALSEQLLKLNRTEFYFSKPLDKGYINQLDFKADGIGAKIQPDSSNIDIITVILPKPLPPGKRTIISTPFKVKLPYNFSRGGHVGNDYQITQWFPKPAVYDSKGWHPMPYLDQGEYYSEFGTYDVQITLPSSYIVAATGVLQDSTTIRELKQNGKHVAAGPSKTWHYKQDNIHDFAWFASNDFIVKYDTVLLASKKVVDLFSFYKKGNKAWNNSIAYAKDGIKKYSNWLGDYPYSTASIVLGPLNEAAGGMEYPTITLITTENEGQDLDATITHELGHNWFYGALATNERTHPWMDEGMNTFYTDKYEKEKYGSDSTNNKNPFAKKFPADEYQMLLSTATKMSIDQPIETSSSEFSEDNYGLIAYVKASNWMKNLQEKMGEYQFNKAMQAYYSTWKFKHPSPQDFKLSVENSYGQDMKDQFELLHKTGPLTTDKKKVLKPSFLFNLQNTDQTNYINITPAVGYNRYDKMMLGGFIHNYKLPLNNFQFIAGGLYSGRAKTLHPFGHASFNVYKKKYQISTSLSYASFSQNDFVVDDNTTLILGVKRIVPSIKITFLDKDPTSSRQVSLQWKTFFLNEGTLDFNTITTPTDTFDVVNVVNLKSTINRLSLGVCDNRKLFPYSLDVTIDQGKEFLRTGITGKTFFNYADGKSGLSARFFAGKFFYLKTKTFITQYNNDRYLLNLSAPKGYEDYTYSDYFIGRNEFEGWQSQQIMERDGYFKVNTELLGNKVGKTDDWLMAFNFSSDIPQRLNPLSVLHIPLKIFVDLGTYAEAWQEDAGGGKFVYDAGLQVSLFSSTLNIYVPLLYSKVYRDYYKSTISENRFMKSISFNININRFSSKEALKKLLL